ncbi:hypothetical protein DESC_60017 [Desulfosarcina cetonica]|nr:hypothetical protein DESC_60017 [Desulfosarcina cetonica]
MTVISPPIGLRGPRAPHFSHLLSDVCFAYPPEVNFQSLTDNDDCLSFVAKGGVFLSSKKPRLGNQVVGKFVQQYPV